MTIIARRAARGVGALLVLAALPGSPPADAQDTPFGGYEAVADGAAFSIAPHVPAVLPVETPVEGTLALALASLSTGGLGYGMASSAYPGTPIAGLRPLLETGAGVSLPIPDYPILVESREHEPARSSRQPGVTMTSDVGPDRAEVTSDLGGFTIPGVIDVGAARTVSRSAVSDTVSAATATEVHGIDVLDGALRIDTVETRAAAATDGETPTCEGGVVVSGATVGGAPVTIDGSGVTAGGGAAVPLTDPDAAVRSVLEATGVEVRVLGGDERCGPERADRTTSGVLVSIPLPAVGAVPPGGRLDVVLGAATARAVITSAFTPDLGTPDLASPPAADVPSSPGVAGIPRSGVGVAGPAEPAPSSGAAGGPGSPSVLAAAPAPISHRFGGVPVGMVAGLALLAVPGARRIRRYVDRVVDIATAP